MPFAITQSCCSDASCVSVCPVNCIHPTPDEPDFGTTEMLYVDPRSCIDCGACADACPVDAIFPVESLRGPQQVYGDLNAAYYDGTEADDLDALDWAEPDFPASLTPAASGLRVAVIGSGPAASYTASALLTTSAQVTMIDRLPVPGGLIRFGVAPDHQSTKAIADRFATVFRNPRLEMYLNVEVGTHLGHDDLLAHHDAVVYAVGATSDRTLDVPGEDLTGSMSARTFVGWYNAHPEIPPEAVDLGPATHGRAVVVGNGNVALDMARVLLGDPEDLGRTDIADHALAALRDSRVTEVVLVARRGPQEAAYSLSELRPLLDRDDLEVVVDGDADLAARIGAAAAGTKAAALRGLDVTRVDWTAPPAPGRRIVLRFDTVVERLDDAGGTGRVDRVTLCPSGTGTAATCVVPTGLVLRSVGYRSEPLAGLPFDEATHTVPHERGRVVDPATGEPVPGTYVVGWIKRGPRGGIGSNRADAAETVAALVDDANAGRVTSGRGSARGLRRLVRERRPEAMGRRDFEDVERLERAQGVATGRPRVKLASIGALTGSTRRRTGVRR